MKNSGGGSRRDTDHVFDFLRRDVEVERDVGERVTGFEPIDEVLDPRPAVDHKRKAERDPWIDNHVGPLVRRQANSGRPTVTPVGDPLQVLAHDLGELVLPGAHYHELQELVFVSLRGVAVQDLGAIGVQPLRRERMLETNALRKRVDRQSDAQ